MPRLRRAALALVLVTGSIAVLPLARPVAHAGGAQADGAQADGAQPPPLAPRLVFHAAPELERVSARLASYDRQRLASVMRIVGLHDPGPPIDVRLVPESDVTAITTPPWVVGFAASADSVIVLFPQRTPAYPDDSLEALLHHEVAHVLIFRASGRRGVPRWFNEGLAMSAERAWRIEDRARVTVHLVTDASTRLADLDSLFMAGRGDVSRAYALSGAFLRHLLDEHGADVGAEILRAVRDGAGFESAVRAATGRSLASIEAGFWRRAAIWYRWVPLLTSSITLWMGITALALVAIARRRQQRAVLRRRWADEEGPDHDADADAHERGDEPPHDSGGRVH